jgi:hypothetical protein
MTIPLLEDRLVLGPELAGTLMTPEELTVFGAGVTPAGECVVSENEGYQTALLPGFELPLARLLAGADAWK